MNYESIIFISENSSMSFFYFLETEDMLYLHIILHTHSHRKKSIDIFNEKKTFIIFIEGDKTKY